MLHNLMCYSTVTCRDCLLGERDMKQRTLRRSNMLYRDNPGRLLDGWRWRARHRVSCWISARFPVPAGSAFWQSASLRLQASERRAKTAWRWQTTRGGLAALGQPVTGGRWRLSATNVRLLFIMLPRRACRGTDSP